MNAFLEVYCSSLFSIRLCDVVIKIRQKLFNQKYMPNLLKFVVLLFMCKKNK